MYVEEFDQARVKFSLWNVQQTCIEKKRAHNTEQDERCPEDAGEYEWQPDDIKPLDEQQTHRDNDGNSGCYGCEVMRAFP